jgi:Xaa-Pro aminopeptidase
MLWDQTKEALIKKFPKLKIESNLPMLAALRAYKTPEEMLLLRRAIAITNMAHNEILKNVKPGWFEYEIQALGEYVFAKNGCEYVGYPSIVGSGENSTILHYETNRRQTKSGDFIEMDMGGEYHGYTADVTRSYPVNGHFTNEQAAIYDLVLEAQDSGIRKARAGSGFRETHFAAMRVIKRGLYQLGIMKDTENYKQYFMHGTSHYLGLDVHDAGPYDTLHAGNVITVEPGIYIKPGSPCDPKWWNIGCRVEDDIFITDGAPVILSDGSPRKRSDVEHLMQHR